jgi:hypothetical protein
VVPLAIVTLVNDATGEQRSTSTNDGGEYTFTAVNPASYTVRAPAIFRKAGTRTARCRRSTTR